MDIIFWSPRGTQVHLDLAIAHPASVQALRSGSALRPGVAAQMAAQGKRRRYPISPLCPAILETGGRVGAEFASLVRSLAPFDHSRT